MPDKLAEKILATKKYRGLYPPTVKRIVADCVKKYPKKALEKKARQLLHQIWSIFYSTRPDFGKLLKTFKADIKDGKNIRAAILPILKIHASTKERIPLLVDFYQKIFAVTGKPKTILDLACGLNPLTYFWLPEGIKYYGFDIDQEQARLLTAIFKLLKVNRVKIGLGDVFIDHFPKADVVFLLKLLPLLEHQKKGSSLEILEKQEAEWLVVSFPTKTVSGKEKGMAEFYAQQFEELIKGKSWRVQKLLFPTELVFAIKK